MNFRRFVFLLLLGLPFVAEGKSVFIDREEIPGVSREDSIVDVPLTICPACCSYDIQVFRPQLKATPETYRMRVFNRWGNLVFETNDYKAGWDGRKDGVIQEPGVYVWQITFTYPGEEEQKHTGSITLLGG